mmetsp:Transcript_6742/g.24873  ORF Transcript_6742/g.24873 Transcript_6742/m.24873 type:complete len:208 (+) Transcript_6742:471-1094(+)
MHDGVIQPRRDQSHLGFSLPEEDVGVADVAAAAHRVQEVIDLRPAHARDEDHLLHTRALRRVDLRDLPLVVHLSRGSALREVKVRTFVLRPRQNLGHERGDHATDLGLGHRAGEHHERVDAVAQRPQCVSGRDVALDDVAQVRVAAVAQVAHLVARLGRSHEPARRRERAARVRGEELHDDGAGASARAGDGDLHRRRRRRGGGGRR